MSEPALRICIVTEIFHPEDKGGMGRQAHAMAERLIGKGLKVDAVTRKIMMESPDRELVGLVPVTRLPPSGVLKGQGWRALMPVLYFSLRLFYWLLCRARAYDVWLVHGTKTILIPVFLARLVCRTKCVLKIDAGGDIGEEVGADSLAKMGLSARSPIILAWSSLRNYLLRRADGVIAISQEIRSALLARGVETGRIHAIPNGVDMQQFFPVTPSAKARLRLQLGLPPVETLVTFAGRLSRAKGLLMLARVWSSLIQSHKGIHLALVGSGGYSFDDCEAELKEFVQQNLLADTVSFVGQVSNVADYLQATDLFVLPSDSEGFPLALVEAMAVGKPSIVTRVSGAVDIVADRDNGMLVPIGDAEALESAFEWLFAHRDEWDSMGQKARATVLRHCEISSVTERYVNLFRSIVVQSG